MFKKLRDRWNRIPGAREQIEVLLLMGLFWQAPAVAWAALQVNPRQMLTRIGDILRQELNKDKGWWMLFPVVMITMDVLRIHPAPPDDLLKHLVASLYQFNYHKLYWGSPWLMHGDPYIGTDWAAGWFYAHCSERWAYVPFQAALMIGFFAVQMRVYPRILAGLSTRYAWSALLILLVWSQPEFVGKIVSGRPETFMALWAFAAIAVEGSFGLLLWVVAGVALIPAYWIAIAYFPAVLILRRSWKVRIALFSGLSAAFALFWGIYTKGQWLHWLLGLHADIARRQFPVGENQHVLVEIFSMSAVLWILLSVWALLARKGHPKGATGLVVPAGLGWLIAWFMVPDMVRYMDVLMPLFSLGLAGWIRDALNAQDDPGKSMMETWAPSAVVVGSLLWGGMLISHQGFTMLPVHIPGYQPGQKVLTPFGPITYDVPYENPGIRVTPAMEIGATRIPLQKASDALGKKGTVSCALLHHYRVNYVVGRLNENPPSCLHLIKMHRSVQIWGVR